MTIERCTVYSKLMQIAGNQPTNQPRQKGPFGNVGFFVQVTHHFWRKNLRLASSQLWCNTPTTLRPKWPRFVARHGSEITGWRVFFVTIYGGCMSIYDDFYIETNIVQLWCFVSTDVDLWRFLLMHDYVCWFMHICVDLSCWCTMFCFDLCWLVGIYDDLCWFELIYHDLCWLELISVDLFWCMWFLLTWVDFCWLVLMHDDLCLINCIYLCWICEDFWCLKPWPLFFFTGPLVAWVELTHFTRWSFS